jgi:hypothetical protein
MITLQVAGQLAGDWPGQAAARVGVVGGCLVGSFVRSAEGVGGTFGYDPMATDVRLLLETVRFPRLLVVGGAVPDVVTLAGQTRTAGEVDLPGGTY